MSARKLVIGSATAVALLVLLATLLWSPAQTPRGPVTPDNGSGTGDPWSDPAGASDFIITRRGDNGQVVEVFGQQLNPKPMGVMEVQWPGARIHLSPNERVVEIRGKHGTFVAPDNQPQSGKFDGPTVLTLFENPGNGPLDLRDDSPHIQMRIFLQDARFDLDLRTIESDELIHLTSQRVDFRGKGLRLTYNELRRRLERLEIFEGEQVRIRRDGELADLFSQDADTGAIEADSEMDASVGSTPTDQPPAENVAVVQYYQANFERAIEITSPEATAVGTSMRLTFAMSPEEMRDGMADRDKADGKLGTTTTNTPAPIGGKPQADRPLPVDASMAEPSDEDIVIRWSGRLLVEPLDEAPVDLASPDDILFAMAGSPLRIDTARSEQVTAAGLDYQLATGRIRLHGSDTRSVGITTPSVGLLEVANLTIDQTQAIGWVDGPGSLRAAGDVPDVSIGSDQGTDLTGLPAGTTISWQKRVDLTFNAKPQAESGSKRRRAKLNQLESVKQITLRGDVDVQHPQLAMQAQNASITLTPSADGKPVVEQIEATGDVHVRAREENDDAEFDVRSQALTVAMEKDEQGRTYPASLVARDDVRVLQPGGRLREASMGEVRLDLAALPDDEPAIEGPAPQTQPASEAAADDTTPDPMATATNAAPDAESQGLVPRIATEEVLTLVPVDPTLLADLKSFEATQPALPDKAADEKPAPPIAPPVVPNVVPPVAVKSPKPRHPKLQVHRVRMQRDVMIDLTDPEVTVNAVRVDADLQADQYELFGDDEAGMDATLYRDGATLAGRHIVMSELNQSVHIDTPGTLTFTGRAPQRDGEDAQPDDRRPIDLTITWTKAMWFDNTNGMALFTGDVVCDAKTDLETSRLTGESLRVRFVTLGSDVLVETDDDADDAAKVQRALLDVQALGDAKFTAAKFRDRADGTLDTRLTLMGPSIVFDNVHQQVQVDSAGQMLFEDYRPDDAQDTAEPRAVDNSSPLSQISGRGATLFTWTGYLRVDVLRNELIIDRDVRMVHRPVGDTRVATLDCRQLTARLKGEGGLGVWLSDDAPQPELAEVLAIDDVRMRAQDRNVATDLLHYDAAAQVMKLSAKDGRKTLVYESDSTQPLQAQHFEWDIARNRVRATKVGVIRVEIGG